MENKTIANDVIANAIIDLCENTAVCDKQTAKGLKTSRKKDILKSDNECSFSKFTQEIIKSQEKKN